MRACPFWKQDLPVVIPRASFILAPNYYQGAAMSRIRTVSNDRPTYGQATAGHGVALQVTTEAKTKQQLDTVVITQERVDWFGKGDCPCCIW